MPCSRGDLHWDTRSQRWIATAGLGYGPDGKRIVKHRSGKTEAKARLREVLRDYEDGLAIGNCEYTVSHAIADWLTYGLSGRDRRMTGLYAQQCRSHILPALGNRKLRDLSAADIDKWLADKAGTLNTRALRILHSCLNRSVKRAMARDLVKRNVVVLCSVSEGRPGRRSKALTLAQAEAVLQAAEGANRGCLAERCLAGSGGVPGGTQQDLPGVRKPASHEPGCQLQAELAVPMMIMLRDTPVRVTRLRTTDPGEEPSGSGEPRHRPVVGCAQLQQIVGDGDSARTPRCGRCGLNQSSAEDKRSPRSPAVSSMRVWLSTLAPADSGPASACGGRSADLEMTAGPLALPLALPYW